MAAQPPVCIRIKRKRDEPSLPDFVLANKRPSLLDRLSLSAPPPESKESVPATPAVAVRYRLVGTAAARSGTAVRDPAALAAARAQSVQQVQGAARFKKLRLLRDGAMASDKNVIELQACASADERQATGSTKAKLVPFGPPLPKLPKKPPPPTAGEAPGEIESSSGALISEADLWADMGAAAEEAAAEAAVAAAEEMEAGYVYDEYAVETVTEASPSAGDEADAGWAPIEIYWEDEFEDDWVDEPNPGDDNGSDSNGEVDYPDEADDSDDDERWGRY